MIQMIKWKVLFRDKKNEKFIDPIQVISFD